MAHELPSKTQIAPQFLRREEAPVRQDGVEGLHRVPLAQYEAVAFGRVRPGRVDVHLAAIELQKDLHLAEIPAYMAALFAAYHVQHLKSQSTGLFSKLLHSDLLLSPRGGLFLERDRAFHRVGQDGLRQAEESQHIIVFAGLAEAVAHAVPEHRDGIFLAHDLCDSAAKAA